MIQLKLTEWKEKFIEGSKSAILGIQNPRKLANGLNKLTNFQKIEIIAVILVISIVTYVISSNMSYWLGRPSEAAAVTVWVDKPTLPKPPPSPTPAPAPVPRGRGRYIPPPPVVAKVVIPRGYTVRTVFEAPEGRLEFRDIGGTGEAIKHNIVFFAGPNLPGYKDVWVNLRAVRDPARRMITLAAIGIIDQRPWNLPADAALSADQQATATTAENTLKEDMAALNTSIMNGNFEPALHDKAFAAFHDYQSKTGAHDDVRIAAAKATVQAGMAYTARIEDARQKLIEKYVDAIDKLLDSGQHEALGDIVTELATGKKKD